MLTSYLLNAGSELFGKKWRTAILYSLSDGPKRFSEIKKDLPSCSVKVLSEALNDMERSSVIIRKQYEGIPVKVTYELDKDMAGLSIILATYYKALVVYFRRNTHGLEFPPHILEQLHREQVSKQ